MNKTTLRWCLDQDDFLECISGRRPQSFVAMLCIGAHVEYLGSWPIAVLEISRLSWSEQDAMWQYLYDHFQVNATVDTTYHR